jgi:DNA-binding transcriptional LysR family regulator
MNLNIDILRILDALDKYGSLNSAAEHLCKTPSAIRYTISKYETIIGRPLVKRNQYRLEFTSLGKSLLIKGRTVLDEINNLENELCTNDISKPNEFKVGIDPSIPSDFLTPLMEDFLNSFKTTKIKLIYENDYSFWSMLKDGMVDVIFSTNAPHPSFALKFDIVCTQILSYRNIVVLSSKLQDEAVDLSNKPIKKAYASSHMEVIVSNGGISNHEHKTLEQDNTIAVLNTEAKINFISYGIGWGYLPDFIADSYIKKGILAKSKDSSDKPIGLLYAGRKLNTTDERVSWWIRNFNDYIASQ